MLGQRLNRALDPQANQGLTCPSGQVMDTERSVFSLFGQYLSDKYLFQLRILPKTLQRVVRTTLGVAKLMFFRRSGIFAVWSGIVAVWSGNVAVAKSNYLEQSKNAVPQKKVVLSENLFFEQKAEI